MEILKNDVSSAKSEKETIEKRFIAEECLCVYDLKYHLSSLQFINEDYTIRGTSERYPVYR